MSTIDGWRTMKRPAAKIDFTYYEPRYQRVFAELRRAGWYPERFVELTDVDLGPDGEPRGLLDLHDYAEAFLHSFYGLELSRKLYFGEVRASIGFGQQWRDFDFEKNGSGINGIAEYKSPYPILGWDHNVAFVTEPLGVVAVDWNFQTYVRTPDPFRLLDWILFREKHPDMQAGYNERKYMPFEFWHLVWDRPLEYHLSHHRAFAVTESGRTDYVIEHLGYPELFKIFVPVVGEVGSTLKVTYRRADQGMPPSLAADLVVCKLLDEFFEGRYRDRIDRIELTDERTKELSILTWPRRTQS